MNLCTITHPAWNHSLPRGTNQRSPTCTARIIGRKMGGSCKCAPSPWTWTRDGWSLVGNGWLPYLEEPEKFFLRSVWNVIIQMGPNGPKALIFHWSRIRWRWSKVDIIESGGDVRKLPIFGFLLSFLFPKYRTKRIVKKGVLGSETPSDVCVVSFNAYTTTGLPVLSQFSPGFVSCVGGVEETIGEGEIGNRKWDTQVDPRSMTQNTQNTRETIPVQIHTGSGIVWGYKKSEERGAICSDLFPYLFGPVISESLALGGQTNSIYTRASQTTGDKLETWKKHKNHW